ncbi:unnamed protein product, partial [Scytosiphon promiscuus]
GGQERSWDGRDSGRGAEGGRGAGARSMWGGEDRQGQRGYSNGYGNGYNNGYNNGGVEDSTSSGRYNNNGDGFDDDGSTRRQGGQGPPIPPRLPNGSGLVRKRKFVPPGRL